MASQYNYSPLAPVYQEKETAIELNDVAPSAPEAPKAPCCESKCASKCGERRSCFGKKGQLSVGQKLCRCFAVTLGVLFTLWLIAGAAGLTFLAAKAHRCMHPRSIKAHTSTFANGTLNAVDLGVVTGKITVRSCRFAKNVTVTARAYAHDEALLNTMVIQMETDATTGTHKASVLQPSFDWRHCQHAWIEVVVPENARLNVTVQALLGHVEIEGSAHALAHVNVNTKVAAVRVHDLVMDGNLDIASELGFIDVKRVNATGALTTRQNVGVLSVHETTAARQDSEVAIGHSCQGNIRMASVSLLAEIGWHSIWNVEADKLSAHVQYGRLSVAVRPEFAGNFSAVSPYGFLDVNTGREVNNVTYTQNDEATVIGAVNADSENAKDFTLQSVYGAVSFFVPNAHHHAEYHDNHPHMPRGAIPNATAPNSTGVHHQTHYNAN